MKHIVNQGTKAETDTEVTQEKTSLVQRTERWRRGGGRRLVQ